MIFDIEFRIDTEQFATWVLSPTIQNVYKPNSLYTVEHVHAYLCTYIRGQHQRIAHKIRDWTSIRYTIIYSSHEVFLYPIEIRSQVSNI